MEVITGLLSGLLCPLSVKWTVAHMSYVSMSRSQHVCIYLSLYTLISCRQEGIAPLTKPNPKESSLESARVVRD